MQNKVYFLWNAIDVKDNFHLGSYKLAITKPRPILVKFLRSLEATATLPNINLLSSPVYIKRDMSEYSLLLNKSWALIQKGYNWKRMKIRNKSIYVDN